MCLWRVLSGLSKSQPAAHLKLSNMLTLRLFSLSPTRDHTPVGGWWRGTMGALLLYVVVPLSGDAAAPSHFPRFQMLRLCSPDHIVRLTRASELVYW